MRLAIALLVSAASISAAGGRWIEAGTMLRPRAGHTVTLLRDGRVLIAGGQDASGPIALAEIFDPKTNTFTPAGVMNHPRSGHTAVLLDDGTVFIGGGHGEAANSFFVLEVEVFDPVLNTFIEGPRMLSWTSTIGSVGGVPFLCTGCLSGTGCQLYRKPLLTSPTFGFWPNGGSALGSLDDGSLLVAGGMVCGTKGDYSTADVFRIDVSWNFHTASTPDGFYDGRASATATSYDRTHVLIAGGLYHPPGLCPPDKCTEQVLDTTRIYDEATDIVIAGARMLAPRWSHVAARLADGSILIAAGRGDGDSPLASAELFDPRANAFRPLPDMPSPRVDAPAVALGDGRVLIPGGSSGTIDKLHSDALIFEPEPFPRRRSVRH